MMVITTSNSTSVKPRRNAGENFDIIEFLDAGIEHVPEGTSLPACEF